MPLFSVESARKAAQLSVAARRAAKERLAALQQAETTLALVAAASAPIPVQPSAEPDLHRNRRIARVRAQLDRLDSMLETETDPRNLDRLAAASSRLEEQERRLSQRSLPPTLSRRLDGPETKPASVLSVVDLPSGPEPAPALPEPPVPPQP